VRRRSAAAVDLLQGAASAGHLFEGAAPVSLLQLATVSRQGLCSAGPCCKNKVLYSHCAH